MGTSATEHLAISSVWIEYNNTMPATSNIDVWNALSLPAIPDPATQQGPTAYTSIESVPIGGLWYANTPEAIFLINSQGSAIL